MAELITDRIPTHDEWRRSFDSYMAEATERYADVLRALHGHEIPAFMTQTGGRCLAIEWAAPNGHFLLTDYDDALSFDRDPDQGWALGFYDDECELQWDDAITCTYKTPKTAIALAMEGFARIRRVAGHRAGH